MTEEHRFCETCARWQAITEFRKRRQSGSARMRQCRQCHNRYERERRAKSRLQSNRKQVGSFLTELKNEENNDRVRMLCNRMFRQFGGFQGCVDAWTDYQQKAFESGGFPAFRCFAAVLRLLEYCSDSEQEVDQLTDEELLRELAVSVRSLLIAQPELAILTAKKLGWTLIPPESDRSERLGTMLF